jgi:hypothetical protein
MKAKGRSCSRHREIMSTTMLGGSSISPLVPSFIAFGRGCHRARRRAAANARRTASCGQVARCWRGDSSCAASQPFLREMERVLSEGVLKVTIASPNARAGSQFNAPVLLVPNLCRAGLPLSGEEFANVAGRAGRAFVDLEGLFVRVMYKPLHGRWLAWRQLVNSSRARSLKAG